MSSTEQKYDYAIIGSGISGLLCGAYLSRKGKRVIVLEKNHQIGGTLQVFSRDKNIFDTGVHYVGSMKQGQTMDRLYRFFGIADQLKHNPLDLDGFDRIVFGDELNVYKLAQGWDRYAQQLTAYFPGDADGIRLLIGEIRRTLSYFLPYNLQSQRGTEIPSEILNASAYETIGRYIQSPRLRAVIGGNSLLYAGDKTTTPFYVFALILNSYVVDASRLVRGGSQIAKSLSAIIHAHGNSVKKYAEVTAIQVTEGRVEAVEVNSDYTISAETFIASVHPSQLIRLLPPTALRTPFKSRIEQLKNTTAMTSVYFSLKPGVLKYFNYNYYLLNSEEDAWDVSGKLDDRWPANCMISTSLEEMNQQFCRSLNVLCYAAYDDFEKWAGTFNNTVHPDERGADYQALKQWMIDRVIGKVDKLISGFSGMIEAAYCATPLSYRDFLHAPDGTAYGIEKNYNDLLRTFVAPKTKVPNLWLTGQNTDLHGVYGAAVSALLTLEHLPEGEHIFEEINADKHR